MESIEIYSMARQVVTLSQQMLDFAHQSQWRSFEATEKQRQKLLTTIFSHQSVTTMLPKIATFMQQVLDFDNESLQLGNSARSEILQELSTIRSNVHKVGAYQQLSSLEPLK